MKSVTSLGSELPQLAAPAHEFAMRFTSTPRGARLARRLVSHRLDDWGHPYGDDLNDVVTLIAAELVANAVRHGHVRGRDFHLRLTEAASASGAPYTLRLEVTDARGERLPRPADPEDWESGRGLLLVASLSSRWGVVPRTPGKCVWADVRIRPVPTGPPHAGHATGGVPHREGRPPTH
ncbi:ATP-binding protein [Streptomyces sp. NPDC048416]|uniref:ATP-binding protein n=1 Tax=Streptomyces sp. NPDC048416 TaxID=3365546 RepID=UPI00371644EF